MTRAAGVAILAVAAAACAHGGGPATASVVGGGAHCGPEEEKTSARWIATEAAYRAALAGGRAVPSEDASAPSVDFRHEGVLAVAMGRRPTAGHALALAEPAVEVVDGVATVVVRFDAPPRGAMVAQVVTSPCLLVRLPRAGIREVRVVDPSGALRAKAPVP